MAMEKLFVNHRYKGTSGGRLWQVRLPTICFILSMSALVWSSRASAEPCEQIASGEDILRCALEVHPDLQRSQVLIQQTQSLRDAAAQIPNPELGSRATFGSNLGDDIMDTEINLAQPLELGGKRGSRIERALAEKEVAHSRVLRTREEVTLSILQWLHRLRQAKAEMATFDEALSTFYRIERQFKSRPRLNPEQEVSIGIFQLAEGDYQLRKAELEIEIETIQKTIELIIRRKLSKLDAIIPKKRAEWPHLSPIPELIEIGGSSIKGAQAQLQLAQAELSVQKSLSWPDLRVGPSFTYQTQGALSYYTVGFNVSLPLPIFNQNGGGRAYARRGMELAERSLNLTHYQLRNERDILVNRYTKSVAAIKSAISSKEVERRHRSTEALFARGLLPSSLVIEAHRQIVDFTKSQNEHELEALQALWKVYILDGNFSELKP